MFGPNCTHNIVSMNTCHSHSQAMLKTEGITASQNPNKIVKMQSQEREGNETKQSS